MAPFSIRLPETTIARLKKRAELRQQPPRTLAQRYLEEAIRQDEHPLIYFVDSYVGRRARLVTGPDVWEVVMVLRANKGNIDDTAVLLDRPRQVIDAALAYYDAYPAEVDTYLEENERLGREGKAAWLAAQQELEA